MRRIIHITLLLFAICINSFGQKAAEGIAISDNWKFKIGDDPDYSNINFIDSTWKTVKVGSWIEDKEFRNNNGIGWYRLKVFIPSVLKDEASVINGLKLSLGLISEKDITYLNGVEIGKHENWSDARIYIIPYSLIKWDAENIVAVRVKVNAIGGGMFDGTYSIGHFRLGDIVDFDSDDSPTPLSQQKDSIFNKSVHFKMLKNVDSIPCNVNLKLYETTHNKLKKTYDFKVVAGNKMDSIFRFSYTYPKKDSFRVEYRLTSNVLPDTLRINAVPVYSDNPRVKTAHSYRVKAPDYSDKTDKFPLEDIKLTGYLADRLNANLLQRLLKIDERGILECYYNRPGKQSWVGEYVGKYIHAASMALEYNYNAQLKAQLDRIVDILLACQNADGYLGNYLPENYWADWGVWCNSYNLYGLLRYYLVTGYQPALEASVKIGNLLCETFGTGKGQLNIVESGPHMGMASGSVLDPMTDLYRITGNKKYLDFCNYIIKQYESEKGPKLISSLTTVRQVNKTATGKAYEMILNLTGMVKLFKLTGEPLLLEATENAWTDIVSKRLYITGTTSKGEYFSNDFDLEAEAESHVGEGCVTTTWLQFNQTLYYLTGENKYMEEIEKTIYNHLLAAENPQTGCVSYFTCLNGIKPYRCNIYAHCCLASIPRGIAAIPELVFTKNTNNGFRINIYTGGQINSVIKTKDGKEIAITCIVKNNLCKDGAITIDIKSDKAGQYELLLRNPFWAENFVAKIKGVSYKNKPGEYITIDRMWNKFTQIEIRAKIQPQALDGGKSYPNYIAIKNGPQVLAFDKSLNPGVDDINKVTVGELDLKEGNTNDLPKNWIGNQIYNQNAIYYGKPIVLKLLPFADAGQTGSEIRVWIPKEH